MNGNFTARVGARITEFMARMRQVQNTIRTTANDVHVDVGADISEFNRRMAEIRARIAALVREKVVVKIEARIEDFQNKINRIATNIRAFGELAQHTFSGLKTSLLPAIVPLISNIGVAIANLGPMLGTVAGSTFALVGAFAAAGAGAVAFGAVAIPTIKALFDESTKLTAQQAAAKASFDAFKSTYDGLVKATEQPVLSAFQSAMTAANSILKTLQPMFISSSKAVAGLMEQLNQSLGTPPVQAFLEYLNTSAGPMLTTFGQAFGNVFKGIGSMLVAFAPLSASTAQGFLAMTQSFAAWANGLSSSAKFQSFMDYVATNMPKIRAIFRDAGAGIVYFFSAFGDSSAGMMDGLVNMMARFKEWSATLSQNQGFQTFMSYVQQSAPTVISLIGNLTQFLVNLGIGMAPLGAAILVLVNKFLEFANSMMENHRIIGVLIAGFISFGGLLLAIVPNLIAFGTLFSGLGTAVMGLATKFITFIPNITSLGTTIAGLATRALPMLGTALGLITSPVGLVIAAIVALTAFFVGLYNTNETFRAQVQTVWEAIKTAISVAVTAVQSLITSVWSQITTFWNENQDSIMATASTVWNVIGTVVTTVMSAIGAIMQFVWPFVKALIVSTWNAIQNVIQGAINVILGIIKTFSSLFQGDWKGVWDGIKQILSGALQAVWGAINLYFVGKLIGPLKSFASAGKTIIQTAWNVIKGIFTNTLNAIKTFVTTIFNAIKTVISTVMNGVKSTTSSIWNAIKSVITTVLNVIKSVVTTIWNGIKSVISSVLSGIKSTVTSIWNAIKAFISNVLNGIKIVVTSIWSAIKSVVTSVLNGIKSVISSVWNGIKSVVESAMNGVKTVIETGWNAAKSFLEGINLLQVGKDIINGLIKGITDSFGAVASALSSLTDKIPSWVKSALGIHSPSRVMIAIAKWIPIGVAEGITGNLNAVAVATKRMTDASIPNFNQSKAITQKSMQDIQKIVSKVSQESAAEVKKIETDLAAQRLKITQDAQAKINDLKQKERDQVSKTFKAQAQKIEEIEKAAEDKIAKIKQTAASKKVALTKAQQNDIIKINKDADAEILKLRNKNSEALATLSKDTNKKIAALEDKAGEDRINASKKAGQAIAKINSSLAADKLKALQADVEARKQAGEMSLSQEEAYWKYSATLFEKGSKEHTAALKEFNAASESLAKERFEDEKSFIDMSEKYGGLSLSKKLKMLEKFAAGHKKHSEEQIYYEEQIAETKKAIYDKLLSLNDTYTQKMQEANQKLIDGTKELNKVYEDAVTSRSSSLYSVMGIFDEMAEKSDVSGQQLTANLKAQNEGFKDWASNISSLASKGIDDGLLAELQALGPKSAAEIAALNTLSATELAEYVSLWQEKSSLARTQAESELVGLKEDTAKKIDELTKETATQLDVYEKEWEEAIKQVKSGTEGQFNAMVATMPQIGANVIKGMQQGLSSMTPALLSQAQSIADSIKSTIEGALDIHSPSRGGKKMIGHNLVRGIIIGLADMQSDAVQAAQDLAEWIKPDVNLRDIINDVGGSLEAIQSELEHKIKVNVEVDGNVGSGGNIGSGGVKQEVHLHSPKHLSPSENARALKRVAQNLA